MIRTLYFSAAGQIRIDLGLDEIPALLQDPTGLLWVDFENTPPEEDEPILRKVFGFHSLAVDDALQESHVPKLDDWGEYLYIVLHAVVYDNSDSGHLDTQELDVFLGRNYLVTHHEDHIVAIERAWDLCQRDSRQLRHGGDHLLYRLADEVVSSYMPVVEEIDDAIELAEDQVFNRPTNATIERIFGLKRSAIYLRRIIGPQREVLNKLARDDYEVIDSHDRIYFRDVYDHLVRLHDITESMRDLVEGVLDTYLSVVNNRMNEVMKTLTVITTLFMPISFITGFFGMNFFQPVAIELTSWTALASFIVMLAVTVLVPSGMLLWMQRRKWM